MILKKHITITMLLFLIITGFMPESSAKSAKEWNKEGMDLYNQGRYEEAIKYFTEALKEAPRASSLWLNKGNAYYKLKNYGKAIGCYDEAIKHKKDFVKVYFFKTLALYNLKKNDEGGLCLDKILQVNPELKEFDVNTRFLE
ncbi:MAG: tetratricopeptide repeat protein, partial [Candidatus Eremiobacterota bacterium]